MTLVADRAMLNGDTRPMIEGSTECLLRARRRRAMQDVPLRRVTGTPDWTRRAAADQERVEVRLDVNAGGASLLI